MIAYDTNILIYALDSSGEWAPAAQNVVRHGERDGAVLSVLVWQELMTGAVLRRDGSEELIAEALRRLGATKFVPVTQSICQRALTLTKRFGKQVYGFDAICLATALEHRATEFVTNDKALLGVQVDGLTIRGL